MHSRGVLALAIGCLVAVAAFALVAATDERELAFTLSVRPAQPVAELAPGAEACQRGVAVPAEFDVVEVLLGTYGEPGPPLALAVRAAGAGDAVATGRLAAGARDNQAAYVRASPEVREGRAVDVCVRNEGDRRVALYGAPDGEVPGTTATVAGRDVDADLRLQFQRSEPSSALALAPDVFERASVFRPGPVGAWTFWVLLAAIALGLPLLSAVGLARAAVANSEDPRYPGHQGG